MLKFFSSNRQDTIKVKSSDKLMPILVLQKSVQKTPVRKERIQGEKNEVIEIYRNYWNRSDDNRLLS